MLFRKKIPRACAYCQYGTRLNDDEMLCIRKGIVAVDHKCRKFIYDPCKRVPLKRKASDFSKYDAEDYTL